MKFTTQRVRDFIPKADGNLKETEPVTFKIRALTLAEKNECFGMVISEGDIDTAPNLTKAFTYGVMEITRLNIDGEEITTASQFVKQPALYAMFAEVAAAVIGFSTVDEPKNS